MNSPLPCHVCGNPLVQRVTTGQVWCAVYGTHDGALRADRVPPAPRADQGLLTYDQYTERWCTVTV